MFWNKRKDSDNNYYLFAVITLECVSGEMKISYNGVNYVLYFNDVLREETFASRIEAQQYVEENFKK